MKMPVYYIPHGGGPWPFVDLPVFSESEKAPLEKYLQSLTATLPDRPKAVVVFSAHWEERQVMVQAAARPPLFYDYYGFPPESYQIEWPAPGQPELASHIMDILKKAGFASVADPLRGFDHGTFIPLKLIFPAADVPTLQVSLLASLDPQLHFALGQALDVLRDEGILLLGSGMSFHNLPAFFNGSGRDASEQFDAWLAGAATADANERKGLLLQWENAPAARLAHPREEHLLPLFVVAGAAGRDPGRVDYSGLFGNARISAFRYG